MQIVADPIDRDLLDNWQRDFPVEPAPFVALAQALGLTEGEVLGRLEKMRQNGRITRVGATCAPNTVSASTLAAIAAPHPRIDEVAAIIGTEPGVNHSYLREDMWNLWFVLTGPDRAYIDAALERIEARAGLRVLDLPMVRAFNVDLGFRMGGGVRMPVPPARPADRAALRPGDRDILQALTRGLTLTARPYAALAERLDRPEAEILTRIGALLAAGLITRLGVIVRHRALGWRANAMVVWDIAADRIDRAGPALAAHPGVTLCYERQIVPGVWPYRLFSMIHARSRPEALEILRGAATLSELAGATHKVLFSTHCYKQTGAMISAKRGHSA
ncbi:MAG: AsnC family transcriptional regulator [Antarcticimicrobium sp.]|uniref:siroheme decarboxylase subunit beta n=1 Tax=Antarcticimicrobium sp. TaxID=2824147 RepID=UPI0026054329|nr:AsnC family transcriptional regulator [Antarcticimicrobium sp.]MDF1718864.1 AsnC family transcriptional regulator [Antarcticimicrobium sp.]